LGGDNYLRLAIPHDPEILGPRTDAQYAADQPHFWLATISTVVYIASMWVNGITQGLKRSAINDDRTLTYSFVEALQASHPRYVVRFVGGVSSSAVLLMAYNVWRTVRVIDTSMVEREASIA
jgi:cytochrome c oxidase cbb3-type subunit 1